MDEWCLPPQREQVCAYAHLVRVHVPVSLNWRQMFDSNVNEEGRGRRKGAKGCRVGCCWTVGKRWGARKGGDENDGVERAADADEWGQELA